jgi:hypothetical protein
MHYAVYPRVSEPLSEEPELSRLRSWLALSHPDEGASPLKIYKVAEDLYRRVPGAGRWQALRTAESAN